MWRPSARRRRPIGDQQAVSGYTGQRLVNTFLDHDKTTGTLTSPEFTVDKPWLSLQVGGGRHPMTSDTPVAVNLLVDGKVVHSATGSESEVLDWVNWDLSAYQGKKASVQIVDQNTGGRGHILVDQIVMANQPASPAARDLSVNLVADGKVVRTATGANSEVMDWTAWDVSELKGKQGVLEIRDNNTGGFGHILADAFTLADQPAQTGIQRAQWLDHGADHYAAVTAGATPTSPWRSNFTVPRELTLAKDKGRYVVSSAPVKEFTGLTGRKLSLPSRLTVDGNKALAGRGKQLDIRMRLDLGQASTAEMDVHVGNGQYTRIGVDRSTSELFIDRRQSGRTALNPDFAAVHRAPIALRGKKVELRIMVDHNSVEVFADGGRIAMTDLVFPDRTSDGLALFSEGGRSSVRNLEVRAVDSIWKRS